MQDSKKINAENKKNNADHKKIYAGNQKFNATASMKFNAAAWKWLHALQH